VNIRLVPFFERIQFSFASIALTALGKSTVAKLLSEASNQQNTLRIIDTDKIGHDILLSPKRLSTINNAGAPFTVSAQSSVYSKVVAAFGDPKAHNQGILDDQGEIDRRRLGDIIFQEPKKRRQLNRITHPRIIRVMLSQLVTGTYSRAKPVMMADVPLLFESGLLRWLFGLTIVVATNADLQLVRLRKRNPDLNETQCRNRIASQMPVERKVAMADVVIWNNGSFDELSKQVELAWTNVLYRLERGRISVFGYLIIASGYMIIKSLPMFFKFY
jgi:dephospho-CoA kinase